MRKSSYDPVNKIWSGPKIPSIYNSDQNLGYSILQVLQQNPDAVTQISADTNVSVTCRQMYDRTIKFAKYLQKISMKEGDMVGFMAVNSENLAPAVFACFVLGLPVNPLSPIMNESDIVQMYSVTKPKIIFCDASNLKVVQNAVNEMQSNAKILTVVEKIDGYECVTDILIEMEDEEVGDFEFPNVDPNATAMVMCSSGSTGAPKGVIKTHKQVIYYFVPYFKAARDKRTVVFQSSHIFWFSGIFFLVAGTLFNCTRVITIKPIEPQSTVDIINKYRVNTLMIAPYAIARILRIENLKPLESITECMITGSPLSKEIATEFAKFVPNGKTFNGYGCTEQNYIAVNYNSSKHTSCGTPFNNVEIKIADEDLKSLGPNEVGEILCSIPLKFSGYFNDPIKTAESSVEGWFKTGDIGYFDDDGYIYVVDRKKDQMKYQNFQVTPSEIESVINEIKGVVSSNVVGVYDENQGNDIIHAFVIVDKTSNVTEKFIIEYVNGKVSEPKKIRGGVHIVDAFPLTFSGKINKIELRKMAKEF